MGLDPLQPLPAGLFTNMVVAGGAVTAALEGKNRAHFSANGDVDLFVYGLEDAGIRAKISSLWAHLKRPGSHCIRTPHTISFVVPGSARRATVFQIICRRFVDPVQTLSAFDIDCCAVCFDGGQFFGLTRAVDSIASRTNTINLALRSWAYEKRLIKYARRGYAIGVEGFRRDEAEIRVVTPVHRGYGEKTAVEGGPTEQMGFSSSWGGDDKPDAYDYWEATGLRKLLIAEYVRDTEGYFGAEAPSKFLLKGSPLEVARCVQLLNSTSVEDEYPPDMSWAKEAGLGENPYHLASSPAPFLEVSAGAASGGAGKKKKAASLLAAARVISFPAGPFPPGAFDKTNADWVGDIYTNHAKAKQLNAPPLSRDAPPPRRKRFCGGEGGLSGMRGVLGGGY